MAVLWRIELFAGLRAGRGDQVLTRFRTQKTAGLLAYLAHYRERSHPREVLTDLLWPDLDLREGRYSLTTALTSLRRQFEPPGVPAGSVIRADRFSVQLHPTAVVTDVAEFEALLERAAGASEDRARARFLAEAVALYRGDLLPGCYEEWCLIERERLAGAFLRALRDLVAARERQGDLARAIAGAERAVAVDPLAEELYHDLLRLLIAAGQPETALRYYRQFERRLARELDELPSPALRRLAEQSQARSVDRPPAFGVSRSGEAAVRDPAAFPMPLANSPGMRSAGLPTGDADPEVGAAAEFAREIETPALPPGAPEAPLPTGTVIFLLAETVATPAGPGGAEETNPSALWPYEDLIRQLVRGYGGHELSGPEAGLSAAFGRARDALDAGIALQRAALRLDSPRAARVVLHVGEVEPGDPLRASPALPEAERLLQAAHGGQLLLSEAAAGLLRPGLEAALRLVDLGRYRLSPAGPPQRLFLVEDPTAGARAFPPPDLPRADSGALPPPFSRFFGRERELAELRALLGGDLNHGDTETRRATEAVTGLKVAGSEVQSDLELSNISTCNPQSPSVSPCLRGEKAPVRLITLTGPGGCGKTRLVLQVAQELIEAFAGAVCFVPLGDLSDPDQLAEAILHAAGGVDSPAVATLDQAVTLLSARRTLLVLDNFEHLIDRGALVLQELLERVPALVCLVTSRSRLQLSAERELAVPPLPTPGRATTPEELMRCPSVQLFVDRAQAMRADFQVTKQNARAIRAICRRLEGLPLALELAAARAQVLTPSQMLEQLARRFDLLVSRKRDIPPRHRSLRASAEWSYRLLSPESQRLFARLYVFRGGFTLEAAEAICGGMGDGGWGLGVGRERFSPAPNPQPPSPIEEWPVIDSVAELLVSSLVTAQDREPALRFGMLESLREYGREQCPPAERAEIERWHAAYFLALAEASGAEPRPEAALARLAAEHDNLRVVLARAIARGDAETGLRLAAALWRFWSERGYWSEGRERLEKLLALPGARPRTPVRARALTCAGLLAHRQGELAAARAHHQESLALWRAQGDLRGTAASLNDLAGVAEAQSRLAEARALHEESLALWRSLDAPAGLVACLGHLGRVARYQDDFAAAHRYLEAALGLCRARDDPGGIALALQSLGAVARDEDQWEEARRLHAESVAVARAAGSRSSLALALDSLGLTALGQGDLEAADAAFAESLALRRALRDLRGIAHAQGYLGLVARHRGDLPAAQQRHEESLSLAQRLSDRHSIAWALSHLATLARLQGDRPRAETLYRESLRHWQALDNRRGLAEALAGLAMLAADAGDMERAATLVAASQAQLGSTTLHRFPAERAEYERHLADVRDALGEDAFRAAWEQGRAMPLDDSLEA